jgi:hypothetical protein
MATRVIIETGKKRLFASAVKWPGWSRVGKDEASALDALRRYRPRYERVAKSAGVPFSPDGDFEVVERLGGSGADFGVPDSVAEIEREELSRADLERFLALLRASWRAFDEIAAKAPAELRKGPRGGGRDRDKIVEHVLGAEVLYASRLGAKLQQPDMRDAAAIGEFRNALADALSRADASTKWPPRYAARRIIWHVLDHAWEIEDRSS